jgi:GAF domain-containing protein
MSPDRTVADTHLAEVEAEQAALRRIAALLARSVPAGEVFDAVVDEVRSLIGVDAAALARYESIETATFLALSAGADARVASPGDTWSIDGYNVTALVLRTGRPSRIDDYTKATGGGVVRRFREAGVRSMVGAPVQVRERCGVRKLGRACKTQQSDVWALRALGRPATSDRLGIAAYR